MKFRICECPHCGELMIKLKDDWFFCRNCERRFHLEDLIKTGMNPRDDKKGFDLETAIKTFLVYKEWKHSEDLDIFLKFVREQKMKIKEPQ